MIAIWIFCSGIALGLFFEQITNLIIALCTRKSREQAIKEENNRKTADFFCNFKIR